MVLKEKESDEYMKTCFFLSLILFLLTTSCSTYKLEGSTSVPALNGKTLYIRALSGDAWIDLDSCEVVHGLFEMKGEVDSVILATLCLGNEGLMPVVLETGKIKVSIENSGLHVSGTPLNEKLYDFISQKNELESLLSDLQHKEMQLIMDGVSANDAAAQVEADLNALAESMNQLIVDFVTSNFDNLLSLNVFTTFCSSFQYPIITPFIEEIMEKAPEAFKEDDFVKEYMRMAEENAK